jgi:transposase
VIDVFVDALDLAEMSFEGVEPAATGRPSYHPSILLKLYIYGYLNQVQSSRRLEREARRNVEVMWLLGRLAPDHKTIADFRKDNGLALRKVCARFVELCREMGLLATASVAIDGSEFKAVNNRDKNFTRAKVERRRAQLEESVARYLSQLDTADRQEPMEALAANVTRLTEKLTKLKEEMGKLAVYAMGTRTSARCCAAAPRCNPTSHAPASRDGRASVRHDESPHGGDTLPHQTLPKVAAEMALSVLAYNLTRVMNIVGTKPLIAAIAA